MMKRPFPHRRSELNRTELDKYTCRDLPQAVRITSETSKPLRKNISKISRTPTVYSPPDAESLNFHRSAPVYFPISKESQNSQRISRHEIKTKEQDREDYSKEKGMSSAELKNIIDNSVKLAVQSVVDDCNFRAKRRNEKVVDGKNNRRMNTKSGKKLRLTEGGHRTQLNSSKFHLSNAKTNQLSKKERHRESIERRSKYLQTDRKNRNKKHLDNRQMTGNVNIFICSEATENNQGRNNERTEQRSSNTSSLGTIISDSNYEMNSTSITSSDDLEASVSVESLKNETHEPGYYRVNDEEIVSGSSDQSYIHKLSRSDPKVKKPLGLENNCFVDKSTGGSAAKSTLSLVNDDGPSNRNKKTFSPTIERRDLSCFKSRFTVCDNAKSERPSAAIHSLKQIEKATGNKDGSHNWNYSKVNGISICRNKRNLEWRRHKDTAPTYCCIRDKEFTVLPQSNICRSNYCKQKVMPCSFSHSCHKRLPSRPLCHNCILEEEEPRLFEKTEYSCKRISSDASFNVCKNTVSGYEMKANDSKKFPEEHVRIEGNGDKLITKATSKDVINSKTTDKDGEKQIKSDNQADSASDRLSGAINRKNIEKDEKIMVTLIDKKSPDVPLTKSNEFNKTESNLVNDTKEKETESNEEANQVAKAPDPPPKPPPVPPKQLPSPLKTQHRLQKTVRPPIKFVSRRKVAETSTKNESGPKQSEKNISERKSLRSKISRMKIQKKVSPDKVGKGEGLRMGQKVKTGQSRSRVRTRAMKESMKKIVRKKTPIRLKSSAARKREGSKQNKGTLKTDTMKNVESKQISKEIDQPGIRRKTFREKVRDSFICKTVRKVVNRIKRSKCTSKAKDEKSEASETEKSSTATTTAQEDEHDTVSEKKIINTQYQGKGTPLDKAKSQTVIRRGARTKIVNKQDGPNSVNRRRVSPVTKLKTPRDKKLGENDVIGRDKVVRDHSERMKVEKKDVDLNLRKIVNPKLLSAIKTKRNSQSQGRKNLQPSASKKVVTVKEEKESKAEKVDEIEKGNISKAQKIQISEEKDAEIKISPSKETEESKKSKLHISTEEAPKSSESEGIKGPSPSQSPEVIKTPVIDKDKEVKGESEKKKDKSTTDLMKAATLQIVPKMDTDSRHVAVEEENQMTRSEKLLDSIDEKNNEFVDRCDYGRCVHYPKSCLKQNKKLSSLDCIAESRYCDCRAMNICSIYKKRFRPDNRCKCVGCQRQQRNDHNYERALNYADTFREKEKRRCRKTLVCLYCDKPRDKCICRMSLQRCSCCKLSTDHCICMEEKMHYCHDKSRGRKSDNKQSTYSSGRKPIEEIRCCFVKDTHDYGADSTDDCQFYGKFKFSNPDDQRSKLITNMVNEMQQEDSEYCMECRRIPCHCDTEVQRRNKGKDKEKNLQDTNPDLDLQDNKGIVRCNCNLGKVSNDWKHATCTEVEIGEEHRGKCYYKESSACTCIASREQSKSRPCRCVDSRSPGKEKEVEPRGKLVRKQRNNVELVRVL